jgi:PEP-CTERM motif
MSVSSRSIVLFVLSVFVGLSTSANAGILYFAYSYTGSGIASAGILTTTDVLVGGAYTITDIQGSRNVNDIGGLLAPGTFGANDNLLFFPAGPFVDIAGFSYQAGALSYNVGNSAAACGSANQYAETDTGFCPGTAVFLNVTPFSPVAGSDYFAYSYTGTGIASAGILTTTPPVSGAYMITDIQGSRNVNDIGGLLAPGTFGANDNLLFFPGGPFVDTAGFSYQAGGLNYNIGNSAVACGSVNQYAETDTGFCPGTAVFMNVTPLRVSAVPEPASFFLFAAGLAGLAFNRRKQA